MSASAVSHQNPFDVLRLLNASPCKKTKFIQPVKIASSAPVEQNKKKKKSRTRKSVESTEVRPIESDSEDIERSFESLSFSSEAGSPRKKVRFDMTKTQVILIEKREISKEERKEQRKLARQEFRSKKQQRLKGF